MPHPHKSTTHEEKFFHLRDYNGYDDHATVFMRKEGESWYGSAALCHEKDNFCRKVGRSVARRKYFLGKKFDVSEPTLDGAYEVVHAVINSMYGVK